MKKRLLSMFLVLVMVLTLVPMTVFAEEVDECEVVLNSIADKTGIDWRPGYNSYGKGMKALDYTLWHNMDGTYTVTDVDVPEGFELLVLAFSNSSISSIANTMNASFFTNYMAYELAVPQSDMRFDPSTFKLDENSACVETLPNTPFELNENANVDFGIIVYLAEITDEYLLLNKVGISKNPNLGESRENDIVDLASPQDVDVLDFSVFAEQLSKSDIEDIFFNGGVSITGEIEINVRNQEENTELYALIYKNPFYEKVYTENMYDYRNDETYKCFKGALKNLNALNSDEVECIKFESGVPFVVEHKEWLENGIKVMSLSKLNLKNYDNDTQPIYEVVGLGAIKTWNNFGVFYYNTIVQNKWNVEHGHTWDYYVEHSNQNDPNFETNPYKDFVVHAYCVENCGSETCQYYGKENAIDLSLNEIKNELGETIGVSLDDGSGSLEEFNNVVGTDLSDEDIYYTKAFYYEDSLLYIEPTYNKTENAGSTPSERGDYVAFLSFNGNIVGKEFSIESSSADNTHSITVNCSAVYDKEYAIGAWIKKENETFGFAAFSISQIGESSYSYSFSNIPDGVYEVELMVEYWDEETCVYEMYSRTSMVLVDGSDTVVNFNKIDARVNSVVQVNGEEDVSIYIGGVDEEAIAQAEEGKNVTVTVAVEKTEEKEISEESTEADIKTQTAIEAIKEQAEENSTLEYINIDIVKQVDNEQEAIIETNDICTIAIPYDTSNKKNITVYRCHEGEASVLPEGEENAVDGEYFEVKDNMILIYTKRFSTYAIGYIETITYSVNISESENGAVSVNNSSVCEGDTVSLVVHPEEGYELKSLTVLDVNGEQIEVYKDKDGSYSFVMPDSDVTVNAKFDEVSQDDNGNEIADAIIKIATDIAGNVIDNVLTVIGKVISKIPVIH